VARNFFTGSENVADGNGAFPSLQRVAQALGGIVSSGQVLCPGPNHSTADRSLSVKADPSAPDGFLVYSFSGDDVLACRDYVREKLGLPEFKPNGGNKFNFNNDDIITRAVMAAALSQSRARPKGTIVAVYDYADDDGGLLYQVVRYEPKGFDQRRPDGKGGWIWQLEKRRVVYRWSELLKFPDATVFVTEGEKDADRIAELNLCATTVATGTWTSDCVNALSDRDIIILQDNDDAGRDKARKAAQALHAVANSIRIVSLPDLPDKGDVSDWLDIDPRHANKFCDVCFDAPLWTPETGEAEPNDTEAKTEQQQDKPEDKPESRSASVVHQNFRLERSPSPRAAMDRQGSYSGKPRHVAERRG
jgi:hypothetical protein